jgi:hypothetical protein
VRRFLALLAFAAIATAVVLVIVLADRSREAAGLKVVGRDTEVTEAEDTDTSLLDGFSKPGSPIFTVESSDRAGPYELRFDLPNDPAASPERLVAASRKDEQAMWALSEGQVVGDRFVVQSSHLSQWQLRILGANVKAPSKAEIERALGVRASRPTCGSPPSGFVVEVDDRSGILLGPCLDSGGVLKLANNRAVSLEFDAPRRSRTRLSSPTLSERFYDSLYQALPGVRLRLLPGAGTATISIGSLPTELRFRADPDATVLELAIALLTRGRSAKATGAKDLETVKCLHQQYGEVGGDSLASEQDLMEAVADLVGACGETIGTTLGPRALAEVGFALDLARLGYGAWDVGRSLADAEARVRVGTVPEKLIPAPASPEAVVSLGTSCGVIEGVYAETDHGVGLEMGVSKGEVSCDTIEAAIRGYLETTGPCTQQGAGTCWRAVGRWLCVAPTYSAYPVGVSCTDEARGQRILGIDRISIAPEASRNCGTAPYVEIPGPFDVTANFDCAAAQRIAAGSMGSSGIYPYTCRVEETGIESAAHHCRFGDSRVSFFSGV